MFNLDDALYAGMLLGVTFDKFTPEEFLEGINVELEHGLVNYLTNVTDNNLLLTAKIALAHLNEYPNYYNNNYGLTKFEEMLKEKIKEMYGD